MFTFKSHVYFDELDPMQMLHNARFAAHVERAVTSWYAVSGKKWETNVADNPDQFHVVRELRIEYLNPVIGPGPIRIDIWVQHLGNTSCQYGFRCASEDGDVDYARGERTIVKIDPATKRPAAWSEFFRKHHQALMPDVAKGTASSRVAG